jgi:FAD/FMN-containing dehydrogenase
MKAESVEDWVNWSGSVSFRPTSTCRPETEEEVASLVREARSTGRSIRPVGHGHSSMPLMATSDILLDTKGLSGLVDCDTGSGVARIRAGTGLAELGPELADRDLALENYGDVDYQAIGGVLATGTHGTGLGLGNFSSNLLGFRMVTGTGEVVEVDERDVEELRAGRLGLGALGVMTEVTMRLVPAEDLHRLEWCVPVEDCLARWEDLVNENRNFDFYWHPRRDEAQIRILNRQGETPTGLVDALAPASGEFRRDTTGPAHEVQPRDRGIRFDEMEHAIPIEVFHHAFEETRERVKEVHRRVVGWRVLCRTVAPDDGFLSPFLDRTSATIANLQNASLPWRDYFDDMEPRMRSHGGRPHFGKKHTAESGDLRTMGLELDRFLQVREAFDPDGVFLNDHLRKLLGVEAKK